MKTLYVGDALQDQKPIKRDMTPEEWRASLRHFHGKRSTDRCDDGYCGGCERCLARQGYAQEGES